MRAVIDANCLASALVRPGGWSARQLGRQDLEWVAPRHLFDELESHESHFVLMAACTPAEWRRRVRVAAAIIRIVPAAALTRFKGHPLVGAVERVDPQDVQYVACLLAAEADFIWMRDKALEAALPGIAVHHVPEPGT